MLCWVGDSSSESSEHDAMGCFTKCSVTSCHFVLVASELAVVCWFFPAIYSNGV